MYKNTRAFLLLPARSPLTQFIRPLVVNFFPAFSFKIAAASRTTSVHVHLLAEHFRPEFLFFFLNLPSLPSGCSNKSSQMLFITFSKGPCDRSKDDIFSNFRISLRGTFIIYWFWWLCVKKYDSDQQSDRTLSECRAVPPWAASYSQSSRRRSCFLFENHPRFKSVLDNFTIAIYIHCRLS